jgi:hypothetical protein
MAVSCIAGAIAALAAGCANQAPVTDEKFGAAVEAARTMQTLNPNAAAATSPAQGVDGASAAAAIARYRESFKNPPATINIFNIGVGTSSGASGR